MPNSSHHSSGSKAEPVKKISVWEKITFFVCGFFLSLLIIALILKVVPNLYGGITGSLGSSILGLFSLKKYQNDLPKKIASIGMLTAVAFLIAATITVFMTLQLAYLGISN